MAARTIRVGVCAGLIGVLGLAAEASAGEAPKGPARDYGAYVKKSETFPKVRSFCDQVLEHGRDTYGTKELAIFVNAFDLTTKTPPPGPQLYGSKYGHKPDVCNLQLQGSLLRLLWHMTDITGDDRYRQAARACLRDYFQHVVHPETGDFPWGTHAGYHVVADWLGQVLPNGGKRDSKPIEEKITDFPWDILYAVNPQGTLRLADRFRLCFDKAMTTWFHHRDIGPKMDYLQPTWEGVSTSMGTGNHPYLISATVHAEAWAYAWSKTKDPKYLDWLHGLLKTVEGSLVGPNVLVSGIVNTFHWVPGDGKRHNPRCLEVAYGSPYLWGHAMLRVHRDLGEEQGKPFLESGLRQLDRWAQLAYDAKRKDYISNIRVYPDADGKHSGGRGGFWTGGGTSWGGGKLVTALLAYADAYKRTGREEYRKVADRLDELYVDPAAFLDSPEPEYALLLGIYLHGLGELYEKSGDARYLPRGRLARDKALKHFYRDGCFLGHPQFALCSHDWGSDDLALAVLKWDMAEKGIPCPIPDSYLFDWGYGGPLPWDTPWDKTRHATPEEIEQFWRGLPPAQDPDQKAGK